MASQIPSATGSSASPAAADLARQVVEQVAAVSRENGKAAPAEGKDLPSVEATAVDLHRSVVEVQRFMRQVRRELQFTVDEHSGHTVITVLNAETGEIVRQIPPEEMLRIARSVAEGTPHLIDHVA